jgi:deoxyribodipyrimidine photolyase-related protein
MASTRQSKTLRLILGDQLNSEHSWFAETDDSCLYLLAELRQETDYVKHHVQKLCAFFAAMENFAAELEDKGHRALHLNLDDTAEHQSLPALLKALCKKHQITSFQYQRPDEQRLLQQLRQLKIPGCDIQEFDSEHFLLPFEEIGKHFSAGKRQRMEGFYRRMRSRHGILMDGDSPAGGRWNFDKENRNKLKTADLEALPRPLSFSNDVSAILKRLDKHGVDSFGNAQSALLWPVSRGQALKLLNFFCQHCLPNFGRFQDAMTCQSDAGWSLYHSRLAFALNTKMLSPDEVMDKAVASYQRSDQIDLAQVEGFVRQILGWREFVRGLYWANMPDYGRQNHFNARRHLPDWFWTGDSRMRCMAAAIHQSLVFAYAHHIQRLMITGNFCLLTGIKPDAVDAWYLGIYIDALEWVEMPNTRGMALFADGGLLASKPYAAGGNYINKMSDYCKSCYYKVSIKTGERACPFNSLYWHFMQRHRDELTENHRLRMLYGSWDRMPKQQREAILDTAEKYLNKLDSL